MCRGHSNPPLHLPTLLLPCLPPPQATARAAQGGVAIANSVATALAFGGGFATAYSQALAQAFAANPAPLCTALAQADATAIAAGKGSVATAAANALALCPHCACGGAAGERRVALYPLTSAVGLQQRHAPCCTRLSPSHAS